MAKFIMFNLITVDGFFAGPDGNIGWHHVDAEFNDFAEQQTAEFGGLVFGRVTYELMAGYWPTDESRQDDPVIAKLMNSLPKLVFSRTLEHLDWENSRLATSDPVTEIGKFMRESDRDVALFGSANLAASLIAEGLIDEFRLLVNPVVLGDGKPLFPDRKQPLNLKLTNTRRFKNGNLLNTYVPYKGQS
jgi:dihydrofolate reductase